MTSILSIEPRRWRDKMCLDIFRLVGKTIRTLLRRAIIQMMEGKLPSCFIEWLSGLNGSDERFLMGERGEVITVTRYTFCLLRQNSKTTLQAESDSMAGYFTHNRRNDSLYI